MKQLHKLFQTKATSVNDDDHSVDFVISTNEVDRYGDSVDQNTWDLKSYEANPIVLWGHNPDEPENVLGTASNIRSDGTRTMATLSFATDVNQKAAMVFDLIKRGVLRTVSVGFRNHSLEWDKDVAVLKDNELLEISVVPIPANAGAVALSLKDGSLHEKDAKWLLTSMKKETELLEKELSKPNKEKSMTEEQAQALIDSVSTLTQKVEAQAATIEELKNAQTTQPPKETEEEKKAREEAEAKAAAEEEAKRKAEEEAKNPPAKSGDNDQDGAGEDDDDFDPEAELTPELQALVDAELEAANAA